MACAPGIHGMDTRTDPEGTIVITALHDEQIPQVVDAGTGLPIGPELADAGPAQPPQRRVLEGRYCRLEPLDPAAHGEQLYHAATPPDAAARHRYLPTPPPESAEVFQGALAEWAASADPLFFAVIDRATGRVEGRQTLMRITPAQRSIEIGNIYWGPAIARTPVATEANYLFACYAFDELGYRRYEWKCDALNAPSRSAALRFGFTFEGHFRRMMINRGRSRDTTWYAIIDEEWPALKQAYQAWLDPGNFDDDGQQRARLRVLTAAALSAG
jgi:RimJ/RimL family protein N-acetyltransferase